MGTQGTVMSSGCNTGEIGNTASHNKHCNWRFKEY